MGPRGGGAARFGSWTRARGFSPPGCRPAVIVSDDQSRPGRAASRAAHWSVAPVTSTVNRVYAFQVLLPAGGPRSDSKAQAEQVCAVQTASAS